MKKTIQKAKKTIQKTKESTEESHYREGQFIEVTSDEDGFRGAWFSAKIIKLPSKTLACRKRSFLIEYQTLLDDEGSKPLVERVSGSFIRPLPPNSVNRSFEVDDVVDAVDNDGWWEGVVTRVLEDLNYSVYFESTGEELEFGIIDMRPHFEWIGGKWVRSEKRKKKPAGIFNTLGETNDPEHTSSNHDLTSEIANKLPRPNCAGNSDVMIPLHAKKKVRKRRKKQVRWPGMLKRKKPKGNPSSKSACSDRTIDTETLLQSDAQKNISDTAIGSEETKIMSAEGVNMVKRKRPRLQSKEKELSASIDLNETMGKETSQAGSAALTTDVAIRPLRSSRVSDNGQMRSPASATTSSEKKMQNPTPNSGNISSLPPMKRKRAIPAQLSSLKEPGRTLATTTLISCHAKYDNPTSGVKHNDLDEDNDGILRIKRRRRKQKEKDLSVISNDLDRTKDSEKTSVTHTSSSMACTAGVTAKFRRPNSTASKSPAYDRNSNAQDAHTVLTRNGKFKHCSTEGVDTTKKRGRPRKQKESSVTTNELGETKDTEQTCEAVNAALSTTTAQLRGPSSGANGANIGTQADETTSKEKVENSTPVGDPMLSLSSRKRQRKNRRLGEASFSQLAYTERAMDTATTTTAMTNSDTTMGSPSSTIKSNENKISGAEGVVARKKLGRPPMEKNTTRQKTVVQRPTTERGKMQRTRSGGRPLNKVMKENSPIKGSEGKASSGEASDVVEAFIKGVLRDIADEYQSLPEMNDKADNIFISQVNEVAGRKDSSVPLLGEAADGDRPIEATNNKDDAFASRSGDVPTQEGPSRVPESPDSISSKDDLSVTQSNEVLNREDPLASTRVLRVGRDEEIWPPVINNWDSLAVSEPINMATTGEPEPSLSQLEVQESTYVTKLPTIRVEDVTYRGNQCDSTLEEGNRGNGPSVGQIDSSLQSTDNISSEKQNVANKQFPVNDGGDDHCNGATDVGYNWTNSQSPVRNHQQSGDNHCNEATDVGHTVVDSQSPATDHHQGGEDHCKEAADLAHNVADLQSPVSDGVDDHCSDATDVGDNVGNLRYPVNDLQQGSDDHCKESTDVGHNVADSQSPANYHHQGGENHWNEAAAVGHNVVDLQSPVNDHHMVDDDHCNEATEVGYNVVNLQSLLNDSTNVKIPMENEKLPFVKRSFMWEKIELMDIFQKIPQRPHFRPLEMYSSTHREGMAIGHMITFSNLVVKINELKFDKPGSNLEDALKTLGDLEALGFNIQKPRARVQKLLELRDRQRAMEVKTKSVEEKIIELRNENVKYDTELVKIDKCVRELEETLAKLTEDLVATTMRKKDNFSEITSLQKEMDSHKEIISSYGLEYRTLASSCWVD